MFIERPDGGFDFGYLSEKDANSIRRQAGPIRLMEDDLRHIEGRHGAQIRQVGYADVPAFLCEVCENFNEIYQGNIPGTLLLIERDTGKLNKAAAIRLQPGKAEGNDYYAIKTAMMTRERYYRKEIPLLQRDAPITRSSERTPFGAGPEADGISLEKARRLVKATGQYGHTEEQKIMAQEHTKLFSYGPLDVFQDPSTQELHVFDADMGGSATLTPGDPLHKTVLQTIEKNRYSKGFVANQINAMIEKEDRWNAPELEKDAISFGPSQKEVTIDGVAETKEPSAGMEVSVIDFNSPEGQAILKEMQAVGMRLTDPAEYDPGTPEVPSVAKEAAQALSKAQPALQEADAAVSLRTQNRLLEPTEYVPERYENGVPEAGRGAASEIARETRTLSKEKVQKKSVTQDAGKEPSEPSPEDPEKRDPSKAPDKEIQEALQNRPRSQEQKEEQKAPENDAAPKPKFDRIRPPAILLDNGKGKPHVLDHGDKITVTNRAMMGVGTGAKDKRRNAVEVALQAAAERFGEPVHFQGKEKFMEETIAVAIQRGIKLEPGNEAAKRMYERALEKIEVNQLGPAKAAPYRAPAKSKEASKDKGVGL